MSDVEFYSSLAIGSYLAVGFAVTKLGFRRYTGSGNIRFPWYVELLGLLTILIFWPYLAFKRGLDD